MTLWALALVDIVFNVEVKYQVKILFPLLTFEGMHLISFKVCRMVYHYNIEVKIDFVVFQNISVKQ